MRYIRRIRIEGFQSHASSVIELDPGLNAITGPSDNGKSAILRALRWVLWNQAPEGEWVRKGCTVALVEVTFSDGTVITRERNKGRNKYTVSVPGAEELSLVDFGRQVPLEVLRAHGMIPVAFDPDKPSLLNLATQLESPFFLSDSAPTRAKILGRLAGVHVIDAAMWGANADLRSRAAAIKVTEADAERVTEQLNAYADLDETEQRVAVAERFLAKVPAVSDRLKQARNAAMRLAEIDRARSQATAVLFATMCVEEAAALAGQAEGAQAKRRTLSALAERNRNVSKQISVTAEVLQRLDGVPEAGKAMEAAASIVAHLSTLRRIAGVKAQVVTSWGQARTQLKRLQGVPAAFEQVAQAVEIRTRLDNFVVGRGVLRRIDGELTRLQELVAASAGETFAAVAIGSAEDCRSRLSRLLDAAGRLRSLDTRLESGRREAERVGRELVDAGREYAAALEQAGVCPTCGQPVTGHTAAHVAASLQGEGMSDVG
jgi:DNA repair protein SbcC/Rad50